MSSLPAARPRPAATVNAEIRALMLRSGGRLAASDRARYVELIAEWAEAVRDTVRPAA
ncbi:hypothetical protein ACFYNV_22360 [Streptomyces albidoflavus]|uniref:hypothetical protein n=1 Tax=Streptomyces albidoflavus TaxID=1886 RepID=UPI0033EE21AC